MTGEGRGSAAGGRPAVPWVALGACVFAGTALRVFHMTAQNLWLDEIDTVRIARVPLQHLTERIAGGGGDLQPTAWLSPLYYLLLKAFLFAAGGVSDIALRASSVLIGAATVPVFAWAVWPLVPPAVAVAATAALALSPFHVWYSQEVRPYVLLVLLATLAVGALARAIRSNGSAWWTGFVLASSLALYTHPVGLSLPLIAGVTCLAAAVRGEWRTVRRALAAVVVTGLLYLPELLIVRGNGMNAPADDRGVGLFDLPYAIYAWSVGFSIGPTVAELHGPVRSFLPANLPIVATIAVVFGSLLLAGVVGLRRLGAGERLLVVAWLVVPLAAALGMARLLGNPFNVRYAIVAVPAFAILVGLGVVTLVSMQGGTVRRAGIVVVTLAVVLVGWSLRNLYFDRTYAKEACSELAAALRADATADDLVLVNVAYMEKVIRYYYPGPAPVVGYPRGGGAPSPDRMASEVGDLIGGRDRIWLVLTRTFHGDRDGALYRLLSERFVVDREERFPGIAGYRFVRPPAAPGHDRG